jgi:hypothetical protein
MTNEDNIKQLEQQIEDLKKENLELRSGKYYTPQYKYINEEILNKPNYLPSSTEIALAKARYAVDEHIWDVVTSLELYIQSLEGKKMDFPYTVESVKLDADRSLKAWHAAQECWDNDKDLWDYFVSDEWFKKAYVDSLSEIHGGDCTALPGSCCRCHAEAMFKIPSTVTWNKHDGYRLFQRYTQDYKEKNNK